MLIDTHAHLNFPDYTDLSEVISRSLAVGVSKIICVSSNVWDSVKAIEVAKKYPGTVYASVGIHPQCTDPENKDSIDIQLNKLEELILSNKSIVVAVGECGLDFTDVGEGERKRSVEDQEILLRGQAGLAKKYNLPILLHFNKAHDHFLEKFQDMKNMRGVFHCYVGGKKRLDRFMEFEGFIFGVNGLITYDEGLRVILDKIPIDRLVFETDCPFLAPYPYRGERNEPSYIPLIAKKVAEVKGVDLEELEKQIENNFKKIFNLN